MDPEEVYEYCFDIVIDLYENIYFEPETGPVTDLVNIRKLIKYIHKNMPWFFEQYNRDYIIPIFICMIYYNAMGFPLKLGFFSDFIDNPKILNPIYGKLYERIDFKALGINQPKNLERAYLKNIKKTLINFFIAHGREKRLTMTYFEFLFSLVEKILPEFLHRTGCWTETVILAIVHCLSKGLVESKFYCSDMFRVTENLIQNIFHIGSQNLYSTRVHKNLNIDFEVPVLKISYNNKSLIIEQVHESLVKKDLIHKIQYFLDQKQLRLDKKLELLDFVIVVLRSGDIGFMDKELGEALDKFIKIMERSTSEKALSKTKELKQIYRQILEKGCLTKVLI